MFTTNEKQISAVVDALIRNVHQTYPTKSVKEIAAILGRSPGWLYKKARELDLPYHRHHSVDEFYDILDTIRYGTTKIVKGYALTTVVNYVIKYCGSQKENVRYMITELEKGIAVKLYISNKPRRGPKRKHK